MSYATLKRKDWFHPDGFPIAIERRDPQEPFGLHAHEFAEIVIITAGCGEHVTGKESYPLNAGDAFVIGGSRLHDYNSMKKMCLVNILFQPDKLRLRTHDLRTLPGYHALFTLEPAWRRRHQFNGRLRLTQPELRTVMAFVDNLEMELHARASGFKFMATAAFMQIAGYLSRCYARAKHPDSRACASAPPLAIWSLIIWNQSILTDWPRLHTCRNVILCATFWQQWAIPQLHILFNCE